MPGHHPRETVDLATAEGSAPGSRARGNDTKGFIEAGVTSFRRCYVGRDGIAFDIDRFGRSASAPQLCEHNGLTAPRIAGTLREMFARTAGVRP